MSLPQTDTHTVTLTQEAAQAVIDLLKSRDLEGHALRVFVQGGGCSGYQYGMAIEANVRPEDMVMEQHGVKLVVDEISIQYLQGASVGYVEDETGSGFKIDNPNSPASCGCGGSSEQQQHQHSHDSCGSGGCGCG